MAETYNYDFGDGFESNEKDTNHTYKLPGVYTVVETVNNNGLISTSSEVITVTPDPDQEYEQSIAERSTRKCFNLGIDPAIHGAGWSEISDIDSDGDYPWPEDPGAVASMFDGDRLHVQVVWDAQDGLPWIIDVRNGPTNSKMDEAWVDKKDINNSNAGTEIGATIALSGDEGEKENYLLEHLESNLFFAPMDSDNAGASGYDSVGYRDAFAVDFAVTSDNSSTEKARVEDVPFGREVMFDRSVTGNKINLKIETESSEFRLTKIESYYDSYDKARFPGESEMNETTWQESLLAPELWLSRGDNLLIDRATGATISGTVTSADGPDGRQDSAMTLASSIALGNDAQSAGTMMFVSTTELDPGSLGFSTFGSVFAINGTNWYLRYFIGVIPADISLPAGTIFDPRIYSSSIGVGATESAMKYYYDTLKNYKGDTLLPVWGIDA